MPLVYQGQNATLNAFSATSIRDEENIVVDFTVQDTGIGIDALQNWKLFLSHLFRLPQILLENLEVQEYRIVNL